MLARIQNLRKTKQSPQIKLSTLESCTKKNTEKFSLVGLFKAKCVSVYDGDTITCVFDPFISGQFSKFKIRLSGIDTPEIRTKDLDEKKSGIEVRDFLRELILDKIIYINCQNFDKYGRVLAYVYDVAKLDALQDTQSLTTENSINQTLINLKYAYAYDGGAKKKFKKIVP